MKTTLLFSAVAGLALVAVTAPAIMAQENVGVEISPTTSLPITGAYESTDGISNFKSYEVDATRAGKYYAEFWLLPAKCADGN